MSEDTDGELSLVSNGVEIVMIKKSFYAENANSLVKNCIRTKLGSLPKNIELKEKLEIFNSWKLFKSKTFDEVKNYRLKSSTKK